jgi:hypothetical protein
VPASVPVHFPHSAWQRRRALPTFLERWLRKGQQLFLLSGSKDPHAEHVALPLAPVGGLCHRILPPVPDAAKATVIPAKAGIQASLILDPGFRRDDGLSDDSLPRLQEIYRQSLWTLTTRTAPGFPERTEIQVISAQRCFIADFRRSGPCSNATIACFSHGQR